MSRYEKRLTQKVEIMRSDLVEVEKVIEVTVEQPSRSWFQRSLSH